MHIRRLVRIFTVGAVAAAASLVACQFWTPAGTTGSLSLSIGANLSFEKTIEPTTEMVVSSYTISGTGPAEQGFTTPGISAGGFSKDVLIIGDWTITVDALNPEGIVIASSQTTVTIYQDQTTTATIIVTPVGGDGTLSIDVSWPADSISSARVVAVLTSADGAENPLDFEIARDGARYTGAWPAGYYSLSLKLLEGSALLVGTADAVRILAAQTAAASYAYQPGAVSLVVASDLQNPITITLSGTAASLVQGESMTVSASCSEAPEGYQWYLDGDPIAGATASSITVGSTLPLGSYVLDVIVAVGRRLSSVGVAFTVRPSTTGFSEDFRSGTAENWLASSSQWRVVDQAYQMTAADSGGAWRYSLYGQSFSFPDFTYQVDLSAPVEGCNWPHSIYIRSWDGSPYRGSYVFSVCEQYGSYWVGTYNNYSLNWTGWLRTSQLKTSVGAVNSLKVVVMGSTMDFYINDAYVHTLADSTFTTGFVGLAVGDGSTACTAVFDNVSLIPTVPSSVAPVTRTEHDLAVIQPGELSQAYPE